MNGRRYPSLRIAVLSLWLGGYALTDTAKGPVWVQRAGDADVPRFLRARAVSSSYPFATTVSVAADVAMADVPEMNAAA